MKREQFNIRLNPRYIECIKVTSKKLTRSDGFIVEMALYEMFKNMPGMMQETPGKKLDDDRGE